MNKYLSGMTLAMIGTLASGCDDGFDAVEPHVAVTDRMTAALSLGGLESVNGTYGAGCTARSGAWSVEIAPGAILQNAPLSVVKNNTGCVLTVTGLVTTSATHAATPSFALDSAYQSSASAFGSGPTLFYANAKLSAMTFAADFVISLQYSDDPRLVSSSNTASYTVQAGSASAEQVAAPNYTIDVTTIVVQTDDADVVQAASGTANLTDGAVTGQSYVIVASLNGSTYADLDAAYTGGTPTSLSGANPQIAAAAFDLVGADLTGGLVRHLIVANTSDGVRSYQRFTVTFNPAQ